MSLLAFSATVPPVVQCRLGKAKLLRKTAAFHTLISPATAASYMLSLFTVPYIHLHIGGKLMFGNGMLTTTIYLNTWRRMNVLIAKILF